jgi:hypothetical protein
MTFWVDLCVYACVCICLCTCAGVWLKNVCVRQQTQIAKIPLPNRCRHDASGRCSLDIINCHRCGQASTLYSEVSAKSFQCANTLHTTYSQHILIGQPKVFVFTGKRGLYSNNRKEHRIYCIRAVAMSPNKRVIMELIFIDLFHLYLTRQVS